MLTAPAAASAAFAHVVAPGESLSSVAATDGSESSPGETADGTAESGSRSEVAASNAGSYVVQPGDTLSAIAERAGMTVDELAAVNGIDPNAPLLSGAVLSISGASPEAAQSATAAAESPEAAEGSSNGPPYPTAETVTPSEVGSIAAENGVPPSLAEAIAYQESGFNNNVTSSAGARGVMQILPGTWNWIGEALAGQPPLAPASAASNVRGGVLLLQSLLNETGGDPELAAAGYYQGLSSVLHEGEAPSPEEYVAAVRAWQQHFGGE